MQRYKSIFKEAKSRILTKKEENLLDIYSDSVWKVSELNSKKFQSFAEAAIKYYSQSDEIYEYLIYRWSEYLLQDSGYLKSQDFINKIVNFEIPKQIQQTQSSKPKLVNISNLIWSEDLSGVSRVNSLDWYEAIEGCPTGWRLPTIEELYTAYIEKVGGFKRDSYWSSTSMKQNNDAAGYVDFSNGKTSFTTKYYGCYVRCVREM